MSTYQCSSCGRNFEAAPNCPQCGAEQRAWVEDLARIERSIAEMKAREAAIGAEQRQIAAQMQAAIFQRDILAHAGEERVRRVARPRRILRRRADRRPPTNEPGVRLTTDPGTRPTAESGPRTFTEPPTRPRVPRQSTVHTGGRDRPPPTAPRGTPPFVDDEPEHQPEASSREVQNILLGLGALLLGVAAVVFAAVAISSLGDLSRLTILIAATAVMLAAPPLVARRGLTSTAETIAAVGLLLVPLDGYALWTVDGIRQIGPPGPVFASLTFLATALIAAAYSGTTGLSVPRYATLLAVQPILPLLAYDWISGPVGWAFVLAAVAAINLCLGRIFGRGGQLAVPWLAQRRRPPADASTVTAPGEQDRAEPVETDRPETAEGVRPGATRTVRPESAGEEADAVLTVEPPRGRTRTTTPAATADSPPDPTDPHWLRDLAWVLHGLAVGIALCYAVAALIRADTVTTAAQAGLALLLAAGVGLVGALALGRAPLPDIAAGLMTLAVIGAAGRVAAVALPDQALLVIAAVIALAGLGVRVVPEAARRGPQLATAVALTISGLVVAGGALRAGLAPIRAALPVWNADLVFYSDELAAAVGSAGWQLAATALLLTIASALSLPPSIRREFAVVGAALTAIAIPASLGLSWSLAPWPPVLAAIGIGLLGLTAQTDRAGVTHATAAALVGLVGAGASMARPGLTAVILFTLTAAGVLVSLLPTLRPVPDEAGVVAAWAAGGAAFALPGAVAAFVSATVPVDPTPTAASLQDATAPVLAASFLAVCATLGLTAITQVSQRQASLPLTLGTGFGALAVTAAAFGAPGATVTDAWVGALLLVAAILLFLAPSIDAGRRADRLLDGSDFAAAAATAGLVGTLARIATILAPGSELAAAALLILVVCVGIRALPVEWRRGPILGVSVSGGVVALIAGYTALTGGIQALAAPGRLWEADLTRLAVEAPGEAAWQVPVALLLLAAAAAIVLPRPWKYDVAVVGVGLATVGAPAALGLPWWSPIVIGIGVATGYGLAAVAAADPRAEQ
ncbi:permease, partial [Micromonospora sonneratiae]